MEGHSLHHLRVPRIVTGLVGRAAAPERVAVWDDVPVRIPACRRDEAPVAFQGVTLRDVRVRDGFAYARLGAERNSPDAAWSEIAGKVLDVVAKRMRSTPGLGTIHGESLYPWSRGMELASRRRGLTDGAGIRFREISDDGRAGQAAAVLELASRLLVVDGKLWARTGVPRYLVTIDQWTRSLRISAPPLRWDEDQLAGTPWAANHFRLDRRNDAIAFVRALATSERPFDPHAWRAGMTGGDPGLVASLYERLGDEDTLTMRGVARTVSEAIRPHLSLLPVAAVARWVELERLADAGDVQALRAWMDGAAASREAMVAAGVRQPRDPNERDNLAILDAAILRYDIMERPRMNLARDGDEAALLSL